MLTSYALGDRDEAVRRIKSLFASRLPAFGSRLTEPDDLFDPTLDRAVRAFQQERGLLVHGIVDELTWEALLSAAQRLGDRLLSFSSHPFHGDDVNDLQERLLHLGFDCGRADGVFGKRTEVALKAFQAEQGLVSDGVCGPLTLRQLDNLVRHVRDGNPNELREDVRARRPGSSPSGRVIVLDAGHGGDDPGHVGHGVVERDIVADVVSRLEGRLLTGGFSVQTTHNLQANPTDQQRALAANQAGADAVISLHLAASASPHPSGASTYFYGATRDRGSVVGARLADLVQRELISRTDLVDCRTHPKTWEVLRLTRMPAIRLEAGYVSNAEDAARLSDATFRDVLADALFAAVTRLFLPQDLDQPTGQIRLAG